MPFFTRVTVFIIVAGLLHSCNTNSTHEKTHEELKQELKAKEQVDPKTYLSATATLNENITQKPDFFHHTKTDGFILSGTVRNSSTVAKFKDVVVTVTYFSETQTAMNTQEYVMYKYFNPTSETLFDYKVYPPAGFKNFSIDVKTATPVN